ncbi:hypothetical protein SELMODRAFT_425547 [Selaginella moellendorffii]|uniref:Uncharacterized protein n=1 Tax=Selaginella moellendorffii TaxID=88036 RepID=D8STG5_SELML|nr:hypothetical protein SELMODRAFT_425547 [Selaginella moellendorffii]
MNIAQTPTPSANGGAAKEGLSPLLATTSYGLLGQHKNAEELCSSARDFLVPRITLGEAIKIMQLSAPIPINLPCLKRQGCIGKMPLLRRKIVLCFSWELQGIQELSTWLLLNIIAMEDAEHMCCHRLFLGIYYVARGTNDPVDRKGNIAFLEVELKVGNWTESLAHGCRNMFCGGSGNPPIGKFSAAICE